MNGAILPLGSGVDGGGYPWMSTVTVALRAGSLHFHHVRAQTTTHICGGSFIGIGSARLQWGVIAMPDIDDSVFLTQLRKLCEEVAGGDYANIDRLFAMTDAPDVPVTMREVAESFGRMAVQVEAREYRLSEMLDELKEAYRQLEELNRATARENVDLKQEVQKLRIDIDQSRKEREVNEIVDSDYFQMLQSRARKLRERNQI